MDIEKDPNKRSTTLRSRPLKMNFTSAVKRK